MDKLGNGMTPTSEPADQSLELSRVLDLFKHRDLWEALRAVLLAEREALVRRVVYSSSPNERSEAIGACKFIDMLTAQTPEGDSVVANYYKAQVEQVLGPTGEPDAATGGGSPWMDPDS